MTGGKTEHYALNIVGVAKCLSLFYAILKSLTLQNHVKPSLLGSAFV